MATENLSKALQAKQRKQELSVRALAKELEISHALLFWLFQAKRTLTKDVRALVNYVADSLAPEE